MRKHLLHDFTQIYHLDLGGDARKRDSGNVFEIMVGVGITILVRHRTGVELPQQPASVYHYKVTDKQSKSANLKFSNFALFPGGVAGRQTLWYKRKSTATRLRTRAGPVPEQNRPDDRAHPKL